MKNDDNSFVISNDSSGFLKVEPIGNYTVFKQPDYRWKVSLFGGDEVIIYREKRPNFWWRWMQYLFFGWVWRPIKEVTDETK